MKASQGNVEEGIGSDDVQEEKKKGFKAKALRFFSIGGRALCVEREGSLFCVQYPNQKLNFFFLSSCKKRKLKFLGFSACSLESSLKFPFAATAWGVN